jgi:enoyl-CoA hydratase/carnithine racemase
MSHLVEINRDGAVLHVVLNRPEKRNALNAALCRELMDALESADADQTVHAILLTASGKAFCAGMDLSEITAPANPAEIDEVHERLFTAGARLATPMIASVFGPALAGGTGLVANCHIVLAAPDATFGLTEIRLGLWPFLVFRACSAAMTERRAIELSLTGRIFPALEAQNYGLVHEIAADPATRAAEIARQVAGSSPIAIRKGLGYVQEARGLGLSDAGRRARAARQEVFDSAEFREGLRAFQQRSAQS